MIVRIKALTEILSKSRNGLKQNYLLIHRFNYKIRVIFNTIKTCFRFKSHGGGHGIDTDANRTME
jgi:hypothetical protein